MTIIEALILGLVQGLTEFLPISSSGHLVIAKSIMGGVREPGILFEVLLHLGTLLAVLLFFRKDIIKLVLSLTLAGNLSDGERKEGRKMVLAVIAGTLPTVVIALLFKDIFEALFSSVKIVSLMLLITGLLLFLSDMVRDRKREKVSLKDALIIGIVQGAAIIPGISRSGSTIAAGLFMGINGEKAAKFSFLLSIPAILGAVVLHAKDISGLNNGHMIPYLAGVTAAAVSGFFSIKVLMKVVAGRRLKLFAFYCWTVGIIGLIYNL
ncbi:MAG: undecaprenyl-diphosphate phosphatase [Deltaproteobacteria bacterium]|nr:undecaprenyl-diphosphate phosphatase [Deltaproteobacteria bacterium]